MVGLVRSGVLQMAVSPELWAEYEEVLRRPKFARAAAAVEDLLVTLDQIARRVSGGALVRLALDADDDRVLEVALWAQADFLITGNLRDYPAEWPVARIVNARQFLDWWDQSMRTASAEP